MKALHWFAERRGCGVPTKALTLVRRAEGCVGCVGCVGGRMKALALVWRAEGRGRGVGGRMKALTLVCRAEGVWGVDESPHTRLESRGAWRGCVGATGRRNMTKAKQDVAAGGTR
jgi:hypothetical protein